MNNRKLLAAVTAAAVFSGVVAAPAPFAAAAPRLDPLGKECKAATAAAKLGQPIPGLSRFVLSDAENAIDGNTLRINSPERYKPYIRQATDMWSKATGGLMRFEFVDQPGYKVVTVSEASLGSAVGRVTGNVHNMQLLLEPAMLRNGYTESLVMTIAHELGHAMGLAHSCDGALMKDGTNRGKLAHTPQPLDVQVLIQHNNLKQYAGQPVQPVPPVQPSVDKPAPAPSLSESTPTISVPPQVNTNPQTEDEARAALRLAERNLAAAQAALADAERALANAKFYNRSRLEREADNAAQRVANAESAVRAAEEALAAFAPSVTAEPTEPPVEPAPVAPTAAPTEPQEEPAPVEPPVVIITVTEQPEPSSEAPTEATLPQATPAAPKPTSLAEAIAAKEAAERAYIEADERARDADNLGIDPEAADRAADDAWVALRNAEANLAAYRAAHPDETLTAEPAITEAPVADTSVAETSVAESPTTEADEPSPVTTTVVTTITETPTKKAPLTTSAKASTTHVAAPSTSSTAPRLTTAETVASSATAEKAPESATSTVSTTVATTIAASEPAEQATSPVSATAETTTATSEPAEPAEQATSTVSATAEKTAETSPVVIAVSVISALLAVIGAGWAIAKFF